MAVPRYAARADTNSAELVAHARLMGAYVEFIRLPVDLAVWTGKSWQLVEIKDPDKEGHVDEFTKPQKKFFEAIAPFGADVWVWRTIHDVQRDLGAVRRDIR